MKEDIFGVYGSGYENDDQSRPISVLEAKLRKIGNSHLITIPSQVINDLKLKAGDDMLLDIKDSKILIRKE